MVTLFSVENTEQQFTNIRYLFGTNEEIIKKIAEEYVL